MQERANSQDTRNTEKTFTLTDRFAIEQIHRLYSVAPANIIGSSIMTIILPCILWEVVTQRNIVIWLGCQIAVILVRIAVVYRYRHKNSVDTNTERWKRRYMISIAFAGMSWGAAGFFLFPKHSVSYQLFLVLLLAGNVAAAASSYAVEIQAYIYFSCPIFFALIVKMLWQQTTLHVTVSATLVMLMFFLLTNIRRWNQTVYDSLTLKLENLDLRKYLASEKERIEALDAQLTSEIVERQTTQNALIAEHNQLRTLVDNLPDYIYVKDMQSRFLLMNKACTGQIGITHPEDMVGKTEFDFMPREYAEKYYADDQEVLRSGKALLNREEQVRIDSTKSIEWRLTTKIPFRDSHGKVAGLVGVSRDITERKLTEQTFRQHNRELILLNHMSDLLQTCENEGKTYSIVMSICKQLFGSDAGYLYILNDARHMLEPVAHWGTLPSSFKELHVDACRSLGETATYCMPSNESSVNCPHVSESAIEGGYICAPISTPGEITGILYILLGHYETGESTEQKELIEAKRLLATRIVRHYALFLSNLRLRETLRMEAIHDPLTHLYNRRYMEEFLDREIRHAKRQDSSIGIILFDIDHFKDINDNYGHEAGDVILQNISRFIKSHIRAEDIPCRYGGEEFLLIFPDIPIAHLQERAEELRAGIAALKTTYQEATLTVTISLGVATIPDHGQEISQVINAADNALYRAKNGGRNQVVTASVS